MPQPKTTSAFLLQGAPVDNVCGDANAGGSCIKFFPAPGCEPPLAYDIATTAIVVGATTATLTLTPPAGYPALAAQPFTFHAKDVITFRTPAGVLVGTVTVAETTSVAAAAVAVPILPATIAIAASDVSLAWLGYPIYGATSIDLTGNDTTVDTTKLKTGSQGSESTTNRMLDLALEMLSNQLDKGIWDALYPYANEKLNDIFLAAYTPPGALAVVGMANLSSFSIKLAAKEKVRLTVNGKLQAPYNTFPIRSSVKPASRLALHDTYVEYAMFSLATFA